jgi:hypothetical protein
VGREAANQNQALRIPEVSSGLRRPRLPIIKNYRNQTGGAAVSDGPAGSGLPPAVPGGHRPSMHPIDREDAEPGLTDSAAALHEGGPRKKG